MRSGEEPEGDTPVAAGPMSGPSYFWIAVGRVLVAAGANLDSACTGTVLREYLSAHDLSGVPDDFVGSYEDGTESVGPATFAAPA